MHETGIAMEVTRIAIETLEKSGNTEKVKSLHLSVGKWSGVEPQTLEFALEAVCTGTPLEGAKAVIEVVAPTFECAECGETYTAEDRFDPCPKCGGYDGRMIAGDEMKLTHIEVGE